METNEMKNSIQDFAIEKWIQKDRVGSILTPEDGDKTFIFLKALYKMPKGQKSIVHLFLSDDVTRENDAFFEIRMFNKLFNVNVLEDYNLQFFSYAAAAVMKDRIFGLVCCDSIQKQLTIEYFQFHLNNKYVAILGVVNTINKYHFFSIASDPLLVAYFGKSSISKEEMLNKVAPVQFTFSINPPPPKNKLNIFVIKNKLDEKNSIVKNETAQAVYFQTEKLAHGLLTNGINKWIEKSPKEGEDVFEFEQERLTEIKKLLNRRNKILRNLQSKKTLVEGLLFRLRGRTIVFGSNVQSLDVSTPNRVISKANPEERNSLIKRTFESGRLRNIGCHLDVKEVPLLNGVENIVIKDLYGSKEDFVNRIKDLRTYAEKPGNVFVVVTEGTQEVVWFNEIVKDLTDYNYFLCDNLISTFNEYTKQEDI